jgi:hypothetical protein
MSDYCNNGCRPYVRHGRAAAFSNLLVTGLLAIQGGVPNFAQCSNFAHLLVLTFGNVSALNLLEKGLLLPKNDLLAAHTFSGSTSTWPRQRQVSRMAGYLPRRLERSN